MSLLDRLRPPHPATCTCVKCVRAREHMALRQLHLEPGTLSSASSRPRIVSGAEPKPANSILGRRDWLRRRLLKNTSSWVSRTVWRLVALAVLGMLVAFVVFIAIHATNGFGFGFGESWSMAFKGFRTAFTCPQEPGKVWEFIDRSEVEELQLQIAQERGEDIYSRACNEGIAATTPTPATPTQIPVSIPTPVPSTTPVSTAVPAAPGPPTQAPTAIATATVPVSPTPSPPPDQVLSTLVQYMLALINDDRLENGLQPVTLGTNPAAQQHAEEMLSEGYLAHWGLDGLKPYMRYTLAGGYNYEAENASDPYYYSDPDVYRHDNILDLLKETQDGLIESPGHRRNILNK